ncbi:MAG TPA: hypothetical protein VEJ86_01770 [Candidatus Binataceae bacterium]|nr:hypothetical protein [Candidatus Binataceae bacterium]
MNSLAANYSSLTAFLEYWRALRSSAARSPEEQGRLEEIEGLLSTFSKAEAAALDAAAEDPTSRRHRERVEHKLRHLLIERGVLTG